MVALETLALTASVIAGGRGLSLSSSTCSEFPRDYCQSCRHSSSAPAPRLFRKHPQRRHRRCHSCRSRRRNPTVDLIRRLSLLEDTWSASRRDSPFLGFCPSGFCLFARSHEATAKQHQCVESSQGLFNQHLSCIIPSAQIPKSAHPARKPRPSLAPLTAAYYYSASPLLKATTLCVLLHAFKQMSPTMIHPPFALLLVCMRPAQSESTMILTSSPIPSTSSLIF